MALSLKEGRGVVGVSLPVRIFEPRSTIERIVDWFSFIPTFLKDSINKKPLERFKDCITSIVSSFHMSVSLWKPFNPILGETFQANFDDGTQISCEHISHHPPISSFLVRA